MKTLLGFFLFFATQPGLAAQSQDFAPVGAKWHYTQKDAIIPVVFPHILESFGKVAYQGKICSELFADWISPLPSPAYVYTQNDTVYFYSPLSNQFEMLYDFTATVGDQWVIGGLAAPFPEIGSDTITVDSISSILVNGVNLKVWHIRNTDGFDWGDRIIEKVGNDMLIAPGFKASEINILELRCFEDSIISLHFVPYPCDSFSVFIPTREPINESSFGAVPNPTTGITTLNLPSDEGGLLVAYNAKGEKVQSKSIASGITQETLDLGEKPAGLYAIVFFNTAGKQMGLARVSVLR